MIQQEHKTYTPEFVSYPAPQARFYPVIPQPRLPIAFPFSQAVVIPLLLNCASDRNKGKSPAVKLSLSTVVLFRSSDELQGLLMIDIIDRDGYDLAGCGDKIAHQRVSVESRHV